MIDKSIIGKRRAMHGEQSFVDHADLRAGDVITCSGRIVGKREAAGETLVDLEIAARNQAGENIQLDKATAALT